MHDVEVQYFQQGGGSEFNISWKASGTKKYVNWSMSAPKENPTGQPIIVAPTTTAVIYRDFFSKAGSRGIGVGYPESVNALFDANYCRWLQLWRGKFLDAAVHWNGRGKGTTRPLGDDVVNLFMADPVAVLKADEKWPSRAEHKGDISGEKSGVRFGGFLLNSKGQPTMLYSLGGTEVTDQLEPIEIDGAMCVKRVVELRGDLRGLHVFAGRARVIAGKGSGPYKIGDELTVTFKLKGFSAPSIRPSDSGFDLLLPVKAGQTSATIEEVIQW